MKHLIFNVNGQSLQRLDSFKPATGSVEYLTVSFTFSDDWSGTTKTAQFRKDDKLYPALINSSGVCTVPYEVLVRDTDKSVLVKQYFYMSVEGVNGTRKITTDEVRIEILPNGQGVVTTPSTPTADVYAQYVEDVKAQTKANADNAQQSAENAEASALSADESARSLKNDYSNALKGNASGAVARVDDVSPVEHYPSVCVYSKNLCPESAFDSMSANGTNNSYDAETHTITLNADSTGNPGRYCQPFKKMKIGVPYTVSFDIRGTEGKKVACGWDKKKANITLTGEYVRYSATLIATNNKEPIVFYTVAVASGGLANGEFMQFANVQIEEGETATEYTPYIDPSTVTVTRCGKNIYNVVAKTQTLNGVTFTVNADGSVTANGTATKATFIGLGSLRVKVGEKYRLSGCPSGGAFDTYLLYIHNNTTGADIYDLGSGKVFTGGEGDLGLTIAVYANVTVNNLVFRPMVVYGEDIEVFEPYNGTEYTPNADGTVEGITSLAPTMTLVTDTENTTVEVEYNRDINVVIADILSKLS